MLVSVTLILLSYHLDVPYLSILQHCIVLDIEGTTTPISFVTDVLFPFAHDYAQKHLISTYDTAETQDDIKLLRAQVRRQNISHKSQFMNFPREK